MKIWVVSIESCNLGPSSIKSAHEGYGLTMDRHHEYYQTEASAKAREAQINDAVMMLKAVGMMHAYAYDVEVKS